MIGKHVNFIAWDSRHVRPSAHAVRWCRLTAGIRFSSRYVHAPPKRGKLSTFLGRVDHDASSGAASDRACSNAGSSVPCVPFGRSSFHKIILACFAETRQFRGVPWTARSGGVEQNRFQLAEIDYRMSLRVQGPG